MHVQLYSLSISLSFVVYMMGVGRASILFEAELQSGSCGDN